MIKQKMRKETMILCILSAILLCGCGREEFPEEEIEVIEAEDIPEKEQETEPGQNTLQEITEDTEEKVGREDQGEAGEKTMPKDGDTAPREGAKNAASDLESARLQKYREVLSDVLQKQIFPDGTECGYFGSCPLSDNEFAVADVDKDGEEELILCFTTSAMAGMTEKLYDYDENTDSVVEEYSGFPGAEFYENGLITEGLSHNQGMASMGDFWPYIVYRYVPETDKYQCIFWVDAWEKECREKDYDGNPYPEEIDQEKSGIVYFVTEGEDYDSSKTKTISKSEYEKWREEQGLDSAEIEILYQALTEENIEKI